MRLGLVCMYVCTWGDVYVWVEGKWADAKGGGGVWDGPGKGASEEEGLIRWMWMCGCMCSTCRISMKARCVCVDVCTVRTGREGAVRMYVYVCMYV